jgi:hypothetical protein
MGTGEGKEYRAVNIRTPPLLLLGWMLVTPLPAQRDSTLIYGNSFDAPEDTACR